MAQQRTVTSRRSLNAATRPNYTPIEWQPIGVSGAAATFQLSQIASSLVRKGKPRILAASLGTFPLSVIWSGSTMTLTWISNLAYPETFSCGPKTTQVRNQSGGYLAANSFVFGLPTPPPAGTIFAPYCSGSDLRGGIANGAGTNIDSLIAANAPSCGYVLPAGWILSTFCTGTDLWGNVTDGAGGTTPMLLSADAPSCGWVPGTIPVGTYLNPTCVGTDLWADVVTSPGVTVNQVVANNSPQCGYTPPLYEFAWAPTQTSTTSLDVQLDPARGPYTILATPYFRPLTSGQPPTSHSIAGTLLTLNYANPLTPNEPILYVYPNTALFAADGGGPSQLTQLLQ